MNFIEQSMDIGNLYLYIQLVIVRVKLCTFFLKIMDLRQNVVIIYIGVLLLL